jgi:hypothetical protein
VTRLASDANLKFHSKKSSLQPRMLKFLEGSVIAQAVITYLVLIGTCMVMGDGALTPSISGTYDFFLSRLWLPHNRRKVKNLSSEHKMQEKKEQ